jgi:hypothetical protein
MAHAGAELGQTARNGVELDRIRLKRRIREKRVAIAWMRRYMREEREPSVAPGYVRRAIADFETQVEAMNARLLHLAAHADAIEERVKGTDALAR